MNRVAKIVFSRTLAGVDWANTTLVKDAAADEIARIKRQPGKDIFVFGSADFSSTVVRHGLVDEYRFGINPVVLGKGTPFFKGGEPQTGLKLLETRSLKSGVVILHYEPVRKQ
jgi:dihydrofolate reductase